MFRHLLAPLDGSPLAESVLPLVVAFATQGRAQITLLHVLERDPPLRIHGAPHLREPRDAEAYLHDAAAWLQLQGVSADLHVHEPRSGVPEEILSHAEQLGADLIVLCSHGGRGWRGLLFGRVAQQVLARGPIPVLTVHAAPEARSARFLCKRILVPLDGTEVSEAVLPRARAIALSFGAELLLVRVVPTVETASGGGGAAARLLPAAAAALLRVEADQANVYLENIGSRLREPHVAVSCSVARGEPVRQVTDMVASRDVDLIAMSTHGHSGTAAVWAGSFAARLLERTACPLLLVRSTAMPT